MGDSGNQSGTESFFSGKIVGGTLSQMATYADLFARLTDAVLLIDGKKFSVLETNPSAPEVLGLPSEKLIGASLLSWVLKDDQALLKKMLQSSDEDKSASHPFDVRFELEGQAKTFELVVCTLKLADYSKVIQVVAKDVTQLRAAEKELREMNERLLELSTTDEMTHLNNLRHFKSELKKEHERAKRYETPYSIVFCDVDHFKKYNDTNGHPAGDEVLKKVAHILKSQSRTTDVPARYGGEEFVVLCPGVDWKGGRTLAEFLRAAVESEDFPHGEKQPLGRVTISIGVASYPDHGKDYETVLKHADEALYESKNTGRNRVTLYNTKKS